MDEKLRELQRRAQEGVEPRRELLHALERAGRPLGDAWGGPIPVRVEGPVPDDALEALAAFDPRRAGAHLAQGAGARLARAPSGLLVVRRDQHGFTLLAGQPDTQDLQRLAGWLGQPWRWRVDRAYATRLACSDDGEVLACASSDGTLRVGLGEQLTAGGARWTTPLRGPARLLAIHDDELLLVDDGLRRFDLAGGLRSELALPEPPRLACAYHGWVALARGTSTVAVYDPANRLQWEKGVGYGARCLSLDRRTLAVARQDVDLYSRADGDAAGSIERASRVTGTWEDPESTMGLGRDVREIREYDPDFVFAVWRADGHLLLATEQGLLSEWAPAKAGLLRRQAKREWTRRRGCGKAHPLGRPAPLVAGRPEDRVVFAPGNCTSTQAWALGPKRPLQLTAPRAEDADAPVSAVAVAGCVAWLARTNGSLERYELPGIRLYAPGGG